MTLIADNMSKEISQMEIISPSVMNAFREHSHQVAEKAGELLEQMFREHFGADIKDYAKEVTVQTDYSSYDDVLYTENYVFRRTIFLIVQHKFSYEKDEKGNLYTIIKAEFASPDKSQDIDRI